MTQGNNIGRIRTYFKDKGYGFIKRDGEKDLLLSSYAIVGNQEKKICLGALVAYDIGEYQGRPVAINVQVLERYKDGIKKIELPNGEFLPIKSIYNFGLSNLYRINPEKYQSDLDSGVSTEDMDYIYIHTPKRELHFFNPDSPYNDNDSKKDIREYRDYLNSFCNL